MRNLLLFCSICWFVGSLSAQKLVGIVYDKANQEPVPGAQVYLEGSSLGGITNADGRFEIVVNSIVNVPLVISHISYQPIFISNPFTYLPDTIFLKEKENLLGEIVVQASKYTRKEMLRVFRKVFLGTSSAASSCVIENEDKIELWYNNLTHRLSAECDVPVRIRNRYLGYRLYVTLTGFEAEFSKQGIKATEPVIKYQCSIIFEDLAPNNKRIDGRRMSTYIGSSSHFLRALANNQLDQFGYELFDSGGNNDMAIDSLNTITASLLLTSELKGYIESPGYYLQDHQGATIALDHLMMTHGWRRYAVSEVVKGSYSRPEIGFEQTREITGTVKSGLLNKPASNREVTVLPLGHIPFQTVTDTAGMFRIELHYPDSTLFLVQAKNQRGSDRVELTINPEMFPPAKHIPVSTTLLPSVSEKEKVTAGFLNKAGQRAQYDEDMRSINLDEIEVTAQRIDKRDELRLRFPVNASSDMTIYREEIERKMKGATRVTDLLINLPGERVSNPINPGEEPKVFIGPHIKTFLATNVPALILVDGMEIGDFPLSTLVSVQDVESIDIFKEVGASAFGSRGMFGAISITTRKWNPKDNPTDYRSNSTSFTPLGFQKPVEFYAPKYDSPEDKNFNIPDFRTTIFWKPDQIISDYGHSSFDFYAADFPTTYSMLIEGISDEGTIIRQVETIEIR